MEMEIVEKTAFGCLDDETSLHSHICDSFSFSPFDFVFNFHKYESFAIT